MTSHRRFAATFALGLAAMALATAAACAAPLASATGDLPGVRAVLEHAGLLADPFATPAEPSVFGPLRVTHHLHASAPQLTVDWTMPDAQGRPTEAVVTVQRWITGTLEIRHTDERGRDQVTSKIVRDSCARQVTLHRTADAGDPAGAHWRVATVSALVRVTPSGRASLPLVDLNTHNVSGGFLSVLSDVGELAVHPQTCAVTAPGDSVRVFIGGIDTDAAVCVFAGHQRVTAVRRDGSHLEATVSMEGPAGLREIGVTVFPRATLADAGAPADTRSWVLPILVGATPPLTQDYFTL